MTARTLLTSATLFGLTASAFAQTTPAPAPSTGTLPTAPAQPQPAPATTSPTPGVAGGAGMANPQQGMANPQQGMANPGVVQSGYAQPMSNCPPAQTGYQPGQVMPAGFTTQPEVAYGGQAMPGGFTPVMGGYTPTYGGMGGYTAGYAQPSFANGYANMGTSASNGGIVSTVVGYPAKITRRLLRR